MCLGASLFERFDAGVVNVGKVQIWKECKSGWAVKSIEGANPIGCNSNGVQI